MALLSAGAAACLAPATSPFCIMGVQTRLLCILCCHAQVWQWAPAGPEDDNTSGWQHLRNHPHTAFYLSTGRNRGVESDIRQECCVPACYTLCFSLDIVILSWEGGRLLGSKTMGSVSKWTRRRCLNRVNGGVTPEGGSCKEQGSYREQSCCGKASPCQDHQWDGGVCREESVT
jgi:hypothetical protein